MPERIAVIGVPCGGVRALPEALAARIRNAQHVWGGARLLNALSDFAGEAHPFSKDLAADAARMRATAQTGGVVVLASGDPGFFGVGAALLKFLPAEEIEFHPQASSLQEAFARLRLPWSGAHFTSVHARPLTELIGLARRFEKLGVLTSPENGPDVIARILLDAGLADCRAVVAENLGEPDERIIDTRLKALDGCAFAALNVLLLVQDEGWRPVPALLVRPDEAYRRQGGMLTRADVRTLALARLRLDETALVWDIGAGSGAVGLECAWLAWRGRVFAVEKDTAALADVRANAAACGARNLTIVEGEAPAALADLPAPDAVFIGGSVGRLAEICADVIRQGKPGCRLVASHVVLEHALETRRLLEEAGWQPQMMRISLEEGQALGGGTRLVPANPVILVSGCKPQSEAHGER